jgi:circadian clock protein KaiC
VKPDIVVIDPIGSLVGAGTTRDATSMVTRLVDFLKLKGITAVFSNLTSGGNVLERTDLDVSSIVDSWILLRDIELGGERNRAMYVLKSRGMAHSNQLREFLLTDHGVDLLDTYVGPEGVLTGSSRVSLEAREKAAALVLKQEAERKERERQRKREALEAKIVAMRKDFEAEDAESALTATQESTRQQKVDEDRRDMAVSRQADDDNGFARPRSRQNSR